MNKTVIALALLGLAGYSQANLLVELGLSNRGAGASHLTNWRHVDILFPITCTRSGAVKVIIYSMVPPTTSTQTNPQLDVVIVPKGNKPVPEGAIEQLTIKADTTEGKQPMDFRQWLKTPKDSLLSDGFTGYVRYSVDLSYQTAPTEFGSDSGQGFVGPTPYADYETKAVQTFMSNLGAVGGTGWFESRHQDRRATPRIRRRSSVLPIHPQSEPGLCKWRRLRSQNKSDGGWIEVLGGAQPT